MVLAVVMAVVNGCTFPAVCIMMVVTGVVGGCVPGGWMSGPVL